MVIQQATTTEGNEAMDTKLSPAQWRAILGAARVGNLALQESGEHHGPNLEASINSAFGELVRAGVIT